MSTDTEDYDPETHDLDPLEYIEQHEDEIEVLADRNDQIGALTRVLLAEARGDTPDEADVRAAGLDEASDLLGGQR